MNGAKAQAQENVCERVMINFGFTSDWLSVVFNAKPKKAHFTLHICSLPSPQPSPLADPGTNIGDGKDHAQIPKASLFKN